MKSEFEQVWVHSERDKRLHNLATRYHTECEAYDRTVCTGPIRNGEITPLTSRELALVNQNAQRIRRRLMDEAVQDGISREDLQRAINNHWQAITRHAN